jgi:chromate transport protein ChrA
MQTKHCTESIRSLFAVATVAMIVVSCVIVILLAAACAYLPYLLMTSVAGQNIQILALFVGGLVIAVLWSLVPKRIKFEAPGLLLDGAAQPRLFSVQWPRSVKR